MDHDAYLSTFHRFYESLPRQGPGDDRYTDLLYRLLPNLPPSPRVADMGCGSGAQTLVLANAGALVTGIDLHQPFLEKLKLNSETRGLQAHVTTLQCSMDAVPPEIGPFDLIWSEGAVYLVGFLHGLRSWFPLLKPGGYVVVSEICWLGENPPVELQDHLAKDIPAMQTMAGNITLLTNAGYRWIGSVLLPHEAWDIFDANQEALIRTWRQQCPDAVQEQVLSDIEKEIDLFGRFRGTYGYVFYMMQRPGI